MYHLERSLGNYEILLAASVFMDMATCVELLELDARVLSVSETCSFILYCCYGFLWRCVSRAYWWVQLVKYRSPINELMSLYVPQF